MIEFIKKVLAVMSDEELNLLDSAVKDEKEDRCVEKRAEFGDDNFEPLLRSERVLALGGNMVDSIMSYKKRTGSTPKQAKKAVEAYLLSEKKQYEKTL